MQDKILFLTYTRPEASNLLQFSELLSTIQGFDYTDQKIVNELSSHRIEYADLWKKYRGLNREMRRLFADDVVTTNWDIGGVKSYIQSYLHDDNSNGIYEKTTDDVVSKPAHYNNYEMETIEAIKGQSTTDEFSGFLKGNIIKYIARYKFKNGVEDLNKAKFYLSVLIGITEGDSLTDVLTDLEGK